MGEYISHALFKLLLPGCEGACILTSLRWVGGIGEMQWGFVGDGAPHSIAHWKKGLDERAMQPNEKHHATKTVLRHKQSDAKTFNKTDSQSEKGPRSLKSRQVWF